ncbi:MAG: flagellar export protein FliJ [Shewanella psychromarinicola]|jgi:flagellar FliJ protein|uniref:Flagellar FliJ protein n=1 Tax=Shewanella psychromarinicola TaxID=2487742 RepID=A0A3N4E9R6_9GAMM|nr:MULTISPECIES: flagellar export protein FliJ [Shewanella]AZG36979.1 flagellar export protein FliJ [Shewanella psychromarinicola]MCL1081184.1 flagellar export protein FliJ [Shewanella psychromarinicola]PKG78214.1 flagellar export protein FliJ [Shewanella sp. Actino-trap-3]RPA34833.1 flagellar export protein FliJ [Shewanella psychromarinicola]|tara:strand:+ start:13720 stop:14166 length:447 start_codon:yes stop_codon:yes gene_type:complete
MTRTDPLLTVLKLATSAEDQAALQLKSAQFEKQKRQGQLDALNNYRLDYMKQMEGHTGTTLRANQYHQFHQFIRQVDNAITQQVGAVQDAEKQVGYRQVHWQETQQKRKAVDMLLKQKAKKAMAIEAKLEQKNSDEFAMQQYFRRKLK